MTDSEGGTGRGPKRRASFFTILLFLCKWWWEIDKRGQKQEKEGKRRKGFWKVALFFLSFFLFLFGKQWMGSFSPSAL